MDSAGGGGGGEGQRPQVFCAISEHQGVRLRVKQILSTSRTYLIAVLLYLVCATANNFTRRAGNALCFGFLSKVQLKTFPWLDIREFKIPETWTATGTSQFIPLFSF